MKKLTLLLLVVITVATGCASSMLKQSENIVFEYQAMTRGANREVRVKQDTVTTRDVVRSKISTTTTINREQWNELLKELDKIELNKINTLKAPTEKRFYDGALIATLTVKTKDSTYRSNSFDHGNPPAEIAALVNKIIAMSALEKESSNED